MIGREFAKGLVIGIVGYDYRQLTGDSGAGALIGPFNGSVDAIGLGVNATTFINKTPLIFNLRQYHEFDAENRWQGDATIASATLIGEARKPLGHISQFEASSLAQPEGSPALAANLASFGKADRA